MTDPATTTTTTTPPASTTTTTPPAATSWVDGLGDDLKGYVQNKGFKEPKDVLESYRNFEKLQGVPKERLLTLPESLESQEMAPVWERLGKPKEAKEYGFEIPKEFGDEKLASWAKETFHKLNVPRSMAEGFVKAWNERQKGSLQETVDQKKAEVTNQHEALKKEWGNAFDQNTNIANQTAQKFGISKEEVSALGGAMGPAKALKFLHKIGVGLGEASYVDGNKSSNQVFAPDQAKAEIRNLIGDRDFSRRLQSGDVDAKNKWDRLHKAAYPGQFTI